MTPVVAVVAAYGRADTVGGTVRALAALPGVDRVVVVDDGSRDRTAREAAAAGARVVSLPANVGKGGAVAAGVAAEPGAAVYLLVDADTGPTAAAAGPLLDPVLSGEADMAVGVLPAAGGRGGLGTVRRLAAAGIRRATGREVAAPLSGQRAVRGDLLRALDLAPRFGLETAMTLDALSAGARVVEVPVEVEHRHTGRSPAGFAHRARQGTDVARALWPRLTSGRTRLRLIAAALAAALVAAWFSGGRWEPSSVPPAPPPPAKVLVFGMPGLAWDDVGTGRLPALDGLLAGGALGAMTVRTASRIPTSVEGYATLGAGSRVRAAPGVAAAAGAGPVTVPGAARLRQDAGRHLPSLPGDLGTALHAAGRLTAVVGNADLAPGLSGADDLEPVRRPAAVAAMDAAGRVDAGTVEPDDLLVADPRAPFGRRADPDRFAAAVRRALAAADVVVADPGDLDRAAALAEVAAPAWFVAANREEALAATDAILGRVVAAAPPGTLVLVVSVRPPGDEWRLTPVVAAGAGVVPGHLHSPSTRRLGLVTLTDVAPTVLAALGAPPPAGMVGHPLRYHPIDELGPGRPDPSRLARLDRDVAYREQVYVGVTIAFIAVQAALYLAIAVALARPRPLPARPAGVLTDLALAVAAFPLATFLFRALPAPGLGRWGLGLLVAVDAALVALARRARPKPLAPLSWIFGATVAVLVVDLATGARLQTGSLLGYSPQSAGRFYGVGNTAFAVLAAATVLVAALHVHHAPRRREALVAVTGLFVLVAVVDGAPGLGDDVGGILTLPPVFALVAVRLWGGRLTWRRVLAAVGITAALLAAATAADLLRPPESRTHLGRLAADVWRDGAGVLWTTIARKAAASLRIMRATPWSWAVPVIAGFVLYVLVWRRGAARLLPPGSALRTGVIGALAAGVLGCVVNDSGVVVLALVLVEVGPVLGVLAVWAGRRGPLPVTGGAGGPLATPAAPTRPG
jgi:hypothetical protein